MTWPLFAAVSLALALALALLCTSLYGQYQNYSYSLKAALSAADPDRASILAYSRAWDFAVIRTSSLFLAYAIVFVGALYVLRSTGSAYRLAVEGGQSKGSLETSSPGLVMVTLGIVLIIAVLYARSSVDIDQTRSVPREQVVPSTMSAAPEPPAVPKH